MMTGKELADEVFAAFDAGKAGNDTALVDRVAGEIARLTPEEMWRFVFAAGSANRGREDRVPFQTLNAELTKRPEFTAALKAMYETPRPAELPQTSG